MISGCYRGSSEQMLGKMSSPKVWSDTGSRLPREEVGSLSLQVFKKCQDAALTMSQSACGLGHGQVHVGGWLDLMTRRAFTNHNDSVVLLL